MWGVIGSKLGVGQPWLRVALATSDSPSIPSISTMRLSLLPHPPSQGSMLVPGISALCFLVQAGPALGSDFGGRGHRPSSAMPRAAPTLSLNFSSCFWKTLLILHPAHSHLNGVLGFRESLDSRLR